MVFSNLSLANSPKSSTTFKADNGVVAKPKQDKGILSDIKANFNNNKAAYVSSGVALAALGVAGVVGHNLSATKKLLQKELSSDFSKKFEETSKVLNETAQELKNSVEGVDKKIEEKAKFFDGFIGEHEKKINGLRNDVNSHSGNIDILKGEVALKQAGSLIKTENVNINGGNFQLADVISHVGGDAREEFIRELRAEPAKRMLGLGKPLSEIPEHGMIRIPTSEIKPFSSTGGLAAVPREIADNLGKMVAGRQDMQVVLDTPLYTGQLSKSVTFGEGNKKTVKQSFYDLMYDADKDIYHYRSRDFVDGKMEKEKLLGDLKHIDTMNVPIVTDNNETIEHVNIFLAEQKIKFDYGKHSQLFTNPVKESMEKTFDAKRHLLKLDGEEAQKQGVKKVKKNIVVERDGKKVQQEVERKYISYDTNNMEVREYEDGSREAFAKVKTVFYDHPKFKLDTPADHNADIYTKEALESGETERFTYFSKFFYEHLANGDNSKVPLKADLIIGNDWHTGPISAMVRQLTTAKKAYGEMAPDKVEKLQNTPIITIMHNTTLDGNSWHSQSKLLNIMFGKHTKEIVENSHMPNLQLMDAEGKNVVVAGLPAHLHNGMFNETNIAPQMMATAYSDYIIPVSKGYEKEITKQSVYGGPRTQLFEFRARTGKNSSTLEDLKTIAKQNGLNPDEVKSVKPTLIGITNGSDKANNTFTPNKAVELAKNLGLITEQEIKSGAKGPFRALQPGDDLLEWHNHNKNTYLDVIRRDLAIAKEGKGNPMAIEMVKDTDLTGVNEKTPVFVSAGRLVDQKGLDILGESIKTLYKDFKGDNYPVFYIQGIGTDPKYKQMMVNAKKEVAKTNPDAAKRIVITNLFSEPGRYDGAKLISDFAIMPSWFEPCGLVHKEIAPFSGAVGVVNRTGGLIDGLKEGKNVIVSEFSPHREHLQSNGENFAKALREAIDAHSDDNKFRAMMQEMMNEDFSWAKKDGPIYEYTSILKDMNVLKPEVADTVI